MILRARSGLPKHCTYQPDPHGKRRVRFRRRGVSTYLPGVPWSAEFMVAYAAALEQTITQQKTEIGAAQRTLPGSVSALILAYYESQFRDLRPSTQRVRRNILERFRAAHGHRMVRDLQKSHLDTIIAAMAKTPEAANNLLKVLRVVLDFAVDDKWIAANPSLRVKRYRPKPRREGDGETGIHTWTEGEIERFQGAHSVDTRAGLAMTLALYTGQRRGDIVRMGWQHLNGNRISVRQQKTGASLMIPVAPELARALAAVPRTNMTFLVTERGASFSAAGFGNWFRRMCNKAGLPHCSIHGLRKSACRRLAEAGCSANEIAAISGHASLREVERYTKAADQQRMAANAMARRAKA
jgi:integrase